ncbi:DUF6221 family protein [Auraticoccus monumenti]|uniref:Uncharacterized protein n=1 Tax=Auraticoccus monumenti TaxID=675864 RepID=A0A1G6SB84_9ACTN|nr:DUF6221 family protein [Auraticoccus monumenti]SDD13387.1 hypothetical protein SAMN04489747_0261 [Auraticoccus monumenti]
MSLREFLMDRIAEDESAARRFMAANHDYADQPGDHVGGYIWSRHVDTPARVLDVEDYEGGPGNARRVLAECDAKRRLIRHVSAVMDAAGAEAVLRLLALPYADHPGCLDEWDVPGTVTHLRPSRHRS